MFSPRFSVSKSSKIVSNCNPLYVCYPGLIMMITKTTAMTIPRLSAASISSVCENVEPAAVMLDVYCPNSNRECDAPNSCAAKTASIHAAHTLLPLKTAISSAGGSRSCSTSAKYNNKNNRSTEAPMALILPTEIAQMSYKKGTSRCYRRLPIFIIFISLLEIVIFVYDCVTVETQHNELLNGSSSVPRDSVLIYRPDKRLEIWRFFSYMVLHANWFHLSFNVVVQLLFGVPLEMVHGSVRVAVIYLAGVFAGSLGTSIVDSGAYLVGASGGVYALLAAQLANILLNFGQMRYGVSQLLSLLIFVLCDLGYTIYNKYIELQCAKVVPSVSHIAHLTGALAGFTMGLLVLRCLNAKAQSNIIWWLAMVVYMSFTLFAIVFNLINTLTAQKLKEEGEILKRHWMHNIGIL